MSRTGLWESARRFAPKLRHHAGDSVALLRERLNASAPLKAFLKQAQNGNHPALIIINDSHRATLTRESLIALRDLVLNEGPLRFHILVACGTHVFPAQERTEFERQTLGNLDLPIEYVAWHDARRDADLCRIGTFSLNRELAAHDFLLPIGSVEPHYFAGFTGPHKTVTIGCMAFEDIRQNHEGALSPDSDILRLDGNPIHRGVLTALSALTAQGKQICCIGQVASGPALMAAEVGEPVDVVHRLVPAALDTFVQSVDAPMDLLELHVPLPLGRNLYQADKALKNNHRAVRDGGGIILCADCPEGVGPGAFLELLRQAPTLDAARRCTTTQGYKLGDHKAVKLRELTDPAARGVHVALVSTGVSDADARAAGLTPFRQLEEARAWIAQRIETSTPRCAIIEDAGFVTVAPPRP